MTLDRGQQRACAEYNNGTGMFQIQVFMVYLAGMFGLTVNMRSLIASQCTKIFSLGGI
jgi:hypothetical protein